MKLKEPSFKAVLATTAGIAIFLGIVNQCSKKEPMTEKIRIVKICPQPTKGDGICEREKGEGDPNSSLYDEESCGYCGDGKTQEHESKETCLADFHCGNGVCDPSAPYAMWVNENGKFSLKVETVTETLENCSEDCDVPPPPPPCGNGKLDKGEECDPIEKKDRCGPKKICSSECKCKKISEKCPPQTITGARVLKNNIASRMRGGIYNIRGALGVDPGVGINTIVTIEVQPSGSASILTSYATCDGKKCPKDAKPHLAAGISSSPSNLPPVYGSEGWCTFSFSVHFPPD